MLNDEKLKTIEHIFIYVVQRVDDPFEGVKIALSQDDCVSHRLLDMRLTESEYALVRRVEYSKQKYIRVIFYRRLYKALEARLLAALEQSPADAVCVYLADEGVWAEWLRGVRRKHTGRIHTINIQHGLFLLERQYWETDFAARVRAVVNGVSRLIWGYPLLGLAFGRGGFDVYLCYGESVKAFLQAQGNAHVYVCPLIIKAHMINRYAQAWARAGAQQTSKGGVLIPLPACVPGTEFACKLDEFLEVIRPLVEYCRRVRKLGVTIRFHPGREREACLSVLKASSLAALVEVDEHDDIVDSLVRSDFVVAVHSTVLFEAGVLGKVPVAVRSRCFDSPLPMPHECIDMREDYETALADATSAQMIRRYAVLYEVGQCDWAEQITTLCGIAAKRVSE